MLGQTLPDRGEVRPETPLLSVAGTGQCLETLGVSPVGGAVRLARNVAQHPTMNRKSPHNKEWSGPGCQEVEESWWEEPWGSPRPPSGLRIANRELR